MIKRILLSAALSGMLFLAIPSLRAQEVNTSNVDHYQSLADSLNENFRSDSAVFYYKKLTPFYLQNADSKNYIKVQSLLIKTLVDLNQFEESLQMASVFLGELLANHPTAYTYISSTYQSLGKIEELYMGDFIAALRLYQQAANVLTEHQPISYTNLALIYKDVAVIQFRIGQPDSSHYYSNKAIELLKKESPPDPVRIGSIYRQIATVKYLQGQYHEGISHIRKGLEKLDKANKNHKEVLSSLYGAAGVIYRSLNLLDSAYLYQNAALQMNLEIFRPTDLRIADNYQNLSVLATSMGNNDLAEELLYKARDIALQNPNSDRLLLVYIYNQLGNLADKKYNGDREAIEYYNEAIILLEEATDPQSLYIKATALSNMGNAYARKSVYEQRNFNDSLAKSDQNKSIDFITEAIEVAENLQGFPPDGLAAFHINLASTLKMIGELEQSKSHYLQALPLLKGIESEWAHYIGGAYAGLSELALDKGDMLSFTKLALKAQEYFDGFNSEDKTKLVNLYVNGAKMHLQAGNLDAADSTLEKAQKHNIITANNEFASNYQQVEIYHTKASILESQYDIKRDTALLKSALNQYRNFSEFVKNTLLKSRDYKDMVNHISLYHRGYFGYLETCYKLYKLTGDDRYKEEALLASEASRSILKKKAILDKNLRSFGDMPDSLVSRENTLDARVTYLTSKVNTPSIDTASRKLFETSLFSARLDKKGFQTMLIKAYPRYFDLKYNDETTSLQSIQEGLKKDENLLVYMMDEGSLYISIVNTSGLSIQKINLPDDFDQVLLNFESGLTNRDPNLYQPAASKLYKYIFAPVKDKLTSERVIIVPDGKIWNINFDLLIDNELTKAVSTPNYLLKAYSFSYRYTATVENVISKKSGKQGFAAFSFGEYTDLAPDVSTFRNKLSDLPGSAQEVRMLSDLYQGVFYYGEQSNEAAFKEYGPQYSILHLALHGEINEQDYDNSRLYFKETSQDTVEDNFLYPFELYNMELSADLVVLSACNSGSGNITRGEGIMSLGRAFRYAGVSSLLLSKWEVSDGTAPEIIISFYRNLDAGMSKDEALRQAKLSFLENADNITSNPYFWGNFFLLGNNDPISINAGINYERWGIILLLFILATLAGFRIKNRKGKTSS